jgi:hypothetical protein
LVAKNSAKKSRPLNRERRHAYRASIANTKAVTAITATLSASCFCMLPLRLTGDQATGLFVLAGAVFAVSATRFVLLNRQHRTLTASL